MPITVEMLVPELIIRATFKDPFVVSVDMPSMLAEVKQLREQADRPVVVLLDMSDVHVDFSQITFALAAAADQIRAQRAAGARLPAQYVFVGSGEMIKVAAQAMSQDQYGAIGGQMYTTMDEALARARAILAGS